MSRARTTPMVLGFLSLVGGLLLLAFSQVSAVLPDSRQTDLRELEGGGVVGEVAGVVFAAFLITIGVLFLLGHASPAPLVKKSIAMTIVALTLPIFLVSQTLLVINGISADFGPDRLLYFSSSYLFHTGEEWSFAAVYVLFMFTLVLVFVLLGALAYLLAPDRIGRGLFDRRSWGKNEALHIAASLFLLLSLSVLFLYLLRLALMTDAAAASRLGLFGQLLLPTYYLLVLLLFALGLTVAAHAFLVNWGSQAPLEHHRLIENLRTIGRVERALVVAAAALNGLILLLPTLPSELDLSRSFAFDLSPRGLSYAFYLLLVPYVPYAVTQRRLESLLRAGRGPGHSSPFSERSLRLVLTHVLGLIVVTALGVGAAWDPLGLMLAMSAWTASVLLVNSIRFESPAGLPRLAFRAEAGPAYYFVFLGLAITTGLMLWGSGNTYEAAASFVAGREALEVANESELGIDVLARVAATVIVAGSLLVTLDLWLNAMRVHRRFFGHYLGVFLSSSLTTLLIFTVGVWTRGDSVLSNAYTGFAFHQYYGLERWGAAFLLIGTMLYLFYALGKILRPIRELSMSRVPPPIK